MPRTHHNRRKDRLRRRKYERSHRAMARAESTQSLERGGSYLGLEELVSERRTGKRTPKC